MMISIMYVMYVSHKVVRAVVLLYVKLFLTFG